MILASARLVLPTARGVPRMRAVLAVAVLVAVFAGHAWADQHLVSTNYGNDSSAREQTRVEVNERSTGGEDSAKTQRGIAATNSAQRKVEKQEKKVVRMAQAQHELEVKQSEIDDEAGFDAFTDGLFGSDNGASDVGEGMSRAAAQMKHTQQEIEVEQQKIGEMLSELQAEQGAVTSPGSRGSNTAVAVAGNTKEPAINTPFKSIGGMGAPSSARPPPICEAARNARARNSPTAPNLEAQCRAAGGTP